MYFMNSLNILEEDRVNILIMGLSGVARKLVAKRSNLINQNDLFSSLAAFFKRPGAEVHEALTTKQMQKESVAAFAARLQANVHDAEITGANGSVDAFLLHLFIENIKPEYATRLKYWGPSTFTAAFESALSYEKECIPPKRERLVVIEENQIQTSADNSALRALQQSIEKLCVTMTPASNKPACNNSQPFYEMKCFHCKELGHSFMRCHHASDREKEEVKRNLPTLLNNMREERKNYKNSLNFKRRSTPNPRLNPGQ